MSKTGTNSFKGKTFEEIYGKEKALLFKKKLSDIRKLNNPMKNSASVEKMRQTKLGKTYEEIYGPEVAGLLREKRRQQGLTKNNSKSLKARAKIVYSKSLIKGCNVNRGKVGLRVDLGIFCRSRWEANIMRLFNCLNIGFEYEPKRFFLKRNDSSIVSYLPDFWIKEWNVYVEVKGYWTKQFIEKKELFLKQHSLIIIDSDIYAKIEKYFGGKIKNWEWERESSETIRQTDEKSEDIVRPVWKHIEQNRNDSVFLMSLIN